MQKAKIVPVDNATEGTTRRERVERKEDAIIAAAHATLLQKGFARTTMAEIARRSGVADGTVYLYFKNKDVLACAVLSAVYDRLTAQAQAGVDALDTTQERLQFLATHHLENIMAERRILEMIPLIDLTLDSYPGSELFDLNKSYTRVFDRVAKDGVRIGDIRSDLNPWVIRDMFFGGLDYVCRTMMVKNREGNAAQLVEEVLRLFLVAPSNNVSQSEIRLEALATRIESAAKRIETGIEDSK